MRSIRARKTFQCPPYPVRVTLANLAYIGEVGVVFGGLYGRASFIKSTVKDLPTVRGTEALIISSGLVLSLNEGIKVVIPPRLRLFARFISPPNGIFTDVNKMCLDGTNFTLQCRELNDVF